MAEIPRYDEKHRSHVRRLIRQRCCNYSKGECLLIDWPFCNACPQWFSQSLNCKWFREAVLPSAPELENAICQKNHSTRQCILCNTRFVPGSNRAKYCPACASKVRRQKERERLHKRYRKSRS